MKLTDGEPTSRPWRIHEIAGDFRLEDIWESLGIKPFLYLGVYPALLREIENRWQAGISFA